MKQKIDWELLDALKFCLNGMFNKLAELKKCGNDKLRTEYIESMIELYYIEAVQNMCSIIEKIKESEQGEEE